LLRGAVIGLVGVSIVCGAVVGLSFATLNRSPTVSYYGLAQDLPRVVGVVRNVSGALQGRSLGFGEFVGALETISKQLATGGGASNGQGHVRLLLATDIHLNPLGAQLTARLADSEVTPVDAVVLGGDLTYFGTEPEARLFVAAFGKVSVPVVMIGGNHEAAPAMAYFKKSTNWQILDGSEASIAGVRILGFEDPVANSPEIIPTNQELDDAATRALDAWNADQPPPNVVLVHELAQAEKIIAAAKEATTPVVVMYGHDHIVKVTRDGSVTEVDGGSAGASGVEQLGSAPGTPYTFQIVDFAPDAGTMRAVSVTTLTYTGDGSSQAEYQPITP
jgi:predicted phosphodiesterase